MIAARLWSVVAALAAVLVGTSAPVGAQAYLSDDPGAWAGRVALEYTVSLQRAKSQLVDVTVRVPNPNGRAIGLRLPTWRPGKYLILDMAGTVYGVTAAGPGGEALVVRKTEKSAWRVEARGPGAVTVSYTVYANSLNDRTRHADGSHAFLDGSAVFMYTDELRDRPVRVRVDAPEGWKVATGLAPDPTEDWAWVAPDYDVLVDSPLEIGEHHMLSFTVDGTPHDVVIWGPVEVDDERVAAGFAKIVRAERDVFEGPGQALPYQRYVFIVHAQPGIGGGTEHLNSTVMDTRPSSFSSEGAFDGFLGLVAHEFFHTWNVKRLRPAGITPYDYQRENYTDLLWVSEGTTTYYSGVCRVRAGLLDADAYLGQLARTISGERRRPGEGVQSLAESSFDAWIKFNRSTPNDINTTVSFYTKGSLVSLMLDMELRRRTRNGVTLDDVLRAMYHDYPLDRGGFTTEQLLAKLRVLSGSGFEGFFGAYVSGVEPLDLEGALETAGILLSPEEAGPGSYLGISERGGSVRTVRSDGPAFGAGVEVDDEIVTVDGEELGGSLDKYLESVEPGTTLVLGLERRGQGCEVEVVTAPMPVERWTLDRLLEPSEEQRAVYESWLGQGWPAEDGV